MYTFDEIATPGCCPNADEVEGDLCDHDLKSIPDGIDGGCPLMLGPTAETGHQAIRFVCTLTGAVPRKV